MFNCSLCRSQCTEYVFVQSHCSKCEEIRRIISLYSVDKVLETLRYVYLRDDESKVDKRKSLEGKREYNLRSKQKAPDNDSEDSNNKASGTDTDETNSLKVSNK